MSYPSSSVVAPGDATLAAHYNNLRADALHLGQLAADSVNLGALLERYESRLTLQLLNTDLIRVPASVIAPVSLMVAGVMVQAVANVDLASADKPSGAAHEYYVFANKTAGATTFTLSISQSMTEIDDQRRIGRFYWDGTAIVKDSVISEQAAFITSLLYFVEPQICQGRLTLSTGVPVPPADIASSGTVMFTPFTGNRVALFSAGYGWRLYAFDELALDVSAVAIDKNLDIFIYDNAGVLTLAYTEWSNATLRATALVRQNGVLVKSGAPAYRYLGTVRTSATGQVCDTKLKRFVWNYYNRIERQLLFIDNTDSWTYSAINVWRELNQSTFNRVHFVIGLNETLVNFSVHVLGENSANQSVGVGIGLDRADANDANICRGVKGLAATYNMGWYGADYANYPGLGYHYLQALEFTSSDAQTTTYYGDKALATNDVHSGGIGSLIC